METVRDIYAAFKLALHLATYSILGLVCVGAFWMPRKLVPFERFYHVDTSKNQSVDMSMAPGRGFSGEMREYTFHLLWDLPFFGFFPFALVLYLELPKERWAKVLTPFLVGYVIFLVVRRITTPYSMVTGLVASLPMAALNVSLYFNLECGSDIPYLFANIVVINLIGVLMIPILNALPGSGETLFIFIGLPLLREVWYSFARGFARKLTVARSVAGPNLNVRRTLTWPFFMWVQITTAILIRIFITKIDDEITRIMVILYQSLLELALRFSLPLRDSLFARFLTLCRRRSGHPPRLRITSIISPEVLVTTSHPLQVQTAIVLKKQASTVDDLSEQEKRSMVHNIFFSKLLLSEMIAEYLAILLAPLLLLIFQDARLQIPFDYFNRMQEPFDTAIDLWAILSFTASQLLSEVVVDTICVLIETRRGYPLVETWRERPNIFPLLLVASSCFASACVFVLNDRRDNLELCYNLERSDMCLCANGRGLNPSGLRQRYCERIYPNSTIPGFPPWYVVDDAQ